VRKQSLTERQARQKVELLEKETGLRYGKTEKEREIRRLMGKEPWFR